MLAPPLLRVKMVCLLLQQLVGTGLCVLAGLVDRLLAVESGFHLFLADGLDLGIGGGGVGLQALVTAMLM